MAKLTEAQEKKIDRMESGLRRQVEGILVNAKLAKDTIYSGNPGEVIAWLKNVQSCATEATQIAAEIKEITS